MNLSFQDNAITHLKDVECFPGKNLLRLKELVFMGNPFVSRELSRPGGDIRYKRFEMDLYLLSL